MDETTDQRLLPEFARDLLLEIAQERSLDTLLQTIVRRMVARPTVALFRLWLIEKGDICSHCVRRPDCPDQTRCLHSVASGGSSTLDSDTDYSHLDDCLTRVPLGVGIIGTVATSGRQVVIEDIPTEAPEMAQLEWVKREKIPRFTGAPIVFKGEMLGVLGVFGRFPAANDAAAWIRILADYVASAIANARAFEEIHLLKRQLELENAYLHEEEAKAFGDLVGQSAALRHIITQVDLVAPTDASVLILGETGTGKELVAREIHRRSKRRDKPLIRVNCASIPKDLYESEFFGHAKGAFTGAIKDRAGRFETADGGTLLLDEVGEVPLELQSKLLRVLQEKRYERVGEDRTRRADVRIIAATNRDLKQEVIAGRFRQDLYYRLNVFPMQVPPLKERKEDIALLAKHFVELSAKELGCPKPRLTRGGLAQLEGYDWPGNIRELRNVIERAVILARGGALEFDLPTTGPAPTSVRMLPVAGIGNQGEGQILTQPELDRRERENLVAALNKADWKIFGTEGAAELLGVKPTTLLSRIKKMGLKRVA